MAQRKYISLSKLSTFLDNLKNLFVSKESLSSLEDEINENIAQKSQVQIITWGADD